MMRDRLLHATLLLGLALCCPTAHAGGPDSGEEVSQEEELPPAELILALRQARIAELEGRSDDALAALRTAAKDYPASILPIVELLDFHRRHGLPVESSRELRNLLKQRLYDPSGRLPLGTLRYLVEDPNAAEEDLTLLLGAMLARLERTQPEPRLLAAVAVLQERLGRLAEARQTLGRLLEVQPSDEVLWHCLVLDRQLERWAAVAEFLRTRVDEDKFSVLRTWYIAALAKLGDLDEIARQIDALGEHATQWWIEDQGPLRELLLRVAWDLRDAGNDAGAEKIFRRLLEIEPNCVEARNALLYLYSTEEERQAHESALAERWTAETDPDALAREGATTLAAGDAARAFDLLRRAAELSPDSEIAWFNLGLAAFRLERWDAAREAMERAGAINPSRAEACLYHGAALQNLGRCAEAVPVLEKALATDPALAPAHYYLYLCHRALGHRDETRRHLELYEKSRAPAQD